MTSSRLSTAFNEVVQVDILFVHGKAMLHVCDEATRWTAVGAMKSKEPHEIFKTLRRLWFCIHGPPKTLITDQEMGLVGDEGMVFLERSGINLKLKAKGQHASLVERHHALWKDQFRKVRAQALSEGINADWDLLISETTFAKNALCVCFGATPYQALYGRTPNLLQEFEAPGVSAVLDGSSGSASSTDPTRNAARVREIALSIMVSGTAKSRMELAERHNTRMAGEIKELQEGDQVDLYRKPQNKDLTGWRGPATVLRLNYEDGTSTVRWMGRDLIVHFPHLRRHLFLNLRSWTPLTSDFTSTSEKRSKKCVTTTPLTSDFTSTSEKRDKNGVTTKAPTVFDSSARGSGMLGRTTVLEASGPGPGPEFPEKCAGSGRSSAEAYATMISPEIMSEQPDPPYEVLLKYLRDRTDVEPIGWLEQCTWKLGNTGWALTNFAFEHTALHRAILAVAALRLRLLGCIGAMIGYGQKQLPGSVGIDSSIVMAFKPALPTVIQVYECPGIFNISLDQLIGENYQEFCVVRFLMVEDGVTDLIRRNNPGMPLLGGLRKPRPPAPTPTVEPEKPDADMDPLMPLVPSDVDMPPAPPGLPTPVYNPPPRPPPLQPTPAQSSTQPWIPPLDDIPMENMNDDNPPPPPASGAEQVPPARDRERSPRRLNFSPWHDPWSGPQEPAAGPQSPVFIPTGPGEDPDDPVLPIIAPDPEEDEKEKEALEKLQRKAPCMNKGEMKKAKQKLSPSAPVSNPKKPRKADDDDDDDIHNSGNASSSTAWPDRHPDVPLLPISGQDEEAAGGAEVQNDNQDNNDDNHDSDSDGTEYYPETEFYQLKTGPVRRCGANKRKPVSENNSRFWATDNGDSTNWRAGWYDDARHSTNSFEIEVDPAVSFLVTDAQVEKSCVLSFAADPFETDVAPEIIIDKECDALTKEDLVKHATAVREAKL